MKVKREKGQIIYKVTAEDHPGMYSHWTVHASCVTKRVVLLWQPADEHYEVDDHNKNKRLLDYVNSQSTDQWFLST